MTHFFPNNILQKQVELDNKVSLLIKQIHMKLVQDSVPSTERELLQQQLTVLKKMTLKFRHLRVDDELITNENSDDIAENNRVLRP